MTDHSTDSFDSMDIDDRGNDPKKLKNWVNKQNGQMGVIQMKLTPDQDEKFETIKWLTDPFAYRGQGRTQVLALAYIHHALKYKIWITVTNHGNSYPMADKELIDRIVGIVHGMEKYTVKIRRSPPAILVEPILKQEEIIKEFKYPFQKTLYDINRDK